MPLDKDEETKKHLEKLMAVKPILIDEEYEESEINKAIIRVESMLNGGFTQVYGLGGNHWVKVAS